MFPARSNAVELILSISALRARRYEVIQNTLIGSVFSNLLLVLGSAFFIGGLAFKEQTILQAVSEANADLLTFAVFGFTIPAAFSYANRDAPKDIRQASDERMSLAVAICLLVIYALFMLFQLYTHAEFYENPDSSNDVDMPPDPTQGSREPASVKVATSVLVSCILLVSVASEFLVTSLDGFAKSAHLSAAFISVVLLPVVGNAVEHMSYVYCASKPDVETASIMFPD